MVDPKKGDSGPQDGTPVKESKVTTVLSKKKNMFSWLYVSMNLALLGFVGGGFTPAIIGAIALLALLVLIAAGGISVILALALVMVMLVIVFVNAFVAIIVTLIVAIVVLIVVFFVGICAIVLGAAAGACGLPLIVTYLTWSTAPLWVWFLAETVWIAFICYTIKSTGILKAEFWK